MMQENKKGEVITFYSYKGGTGRTMALANIACLLAMQDTSKRILIIDWDIEAPGLHRYFSPYLATTGVSDFDLELKEQEGILELFKAYETILIEQKKVVEDSEEVIKKTLEGINLQQYIIPLSIAKKKTTREIHSPIQNISLLKAGRYNSGYPQKIAAFDWDAFYYEAPLFFTRFANFLSEQFDYVLIDSRTGNTDTSGICTHLLPEKLVVVFTPNNQSLTGIIGLSQKASQYRIDFQDARPLEIFPLPSRVELGEDRLRQIWRSGDDHQMEGYQLKFEKLFNDVYHLNDCSLHDYFNQVQIRHASSYAYGERIACLEEDYHNTSSFANNFWLFQQQLFKGEDIYTLPHQVNVLVYYPNAVSGAIASEIVDDLYDMEEREIVTFYATATTNETELQQLLKKADIVVQLQVESISTNLSVESNVQNVSEKKEIYQSRNDLIVNDFFRKNHQTRSINIKLDPFGNLLESEATGEPDKLEDIQEKIFSTIERIKQQSLSSDTHPQIEEQAAILKEIIHTYHQESDLIKASLRHIRKLTNQSDINKADAFIKLINDQSIVSNWSEVGRLKFRQGIELLTTWNDYLISYSNANLIHYYNDYNPIIEYILGPLKAGQWETRNPMSRIIDKLLITEGLKGFYSAKSLSFGVSLEEEIRNSFHSFSLIQILDKDTFFKTLPYEEYKAFISINKQSRIRPLFLPVIMEEDIFPIQPKGISKDWLAAIKKHLYLDFHNLVQGHNTPRSAVHKLKKEIRKMAITIIEHKEAFLDKFIEGEEEENIAV